ncbi:MAG TPA: polysaccharide biosynthesis C-terminal domain-containing protein [Beijerinckiaceae bacterium]|jgi:O-antigen/teichoic acid export membrane protein
MIIVAAFLANAGLNFALGLLVAKLLGPGEFGRYAVAMAVAVVINTLGFEWLRLSATRFYSEESRRSVPGLRATLDLGYAAVSLSLAALVGVGCLAGVEPGMPAALLAAAAAAGIGMGLFDYRAALARARFRERSYAELVLAKNAAAFVLMVGGAFVFGNAALVLMGGALSGAAALLVARRALADPDLRLGLAERRHLKIFAAYAAPLVAASLLYQLMPLMNRAALAYAEGYAEAGRFSLSADVGLRLFMTLGSGLDILLFQLAVRADEAHGRAEAERQVARNLAVVVALLLPFAAGYWLVLPAFEALVVPQAFRGSFGTYAAALIPAFTAFALIQYALNPVFQLRKRTAPVILAAFAGLALNAALLPLLLPAFGPVGVALAQLSGLVAGSVLLAGLAVRSGGLRLPWRDLLLAAGATAAMIAILLPLRAVHPPALGLALMAALGIATYGALAYALDIASARTLLRSRLERMRPMRAPAE